MEELKNHIKGAENERRRLLKYIDYLNIIIWMSSKNEQIQNYPLQYGTSKETGC